MSPHLEVGVGADFVVLVVGKLDEVVPGYSRNIQVYMGWLELKGLQHLWQVHGIVGTAGGRTVRTEYESLQQMSKIAKGILGEPQERKLYDREEIILSSILTRLDLSLTPIVVFWTPKTRGPARKELPIKIAHAKP